MNYEILDKIEFEKHVKKMSSEIRSNSECAIELYLSNYIFFLLNEFIKETEKLGRGNEKECVNVA